MKRVDLKDTYCWSQTIHAPFDGVVVETKDGREERNPVHFIRDFALVLKNAFLFSAKRNEDLHPVLGNYIILKKEEGIYSLKAHARNGAIKVAKGEKVTEGQRLAEVGHSGNSTAPHLHFQIMDRPQLLEAEGLPCSFKSYQLYKQGKWEPVTNARPGKRERISA
jgi:murein DD-endopeptidase MepM/ murein hydrolase activator NlpD